MDRRSLLAGRASDVLSIGVSTRPEECEIPILDYILSRLNVIKRNAYRLGSTLVLHCFAYVVRQDGTS